LHNVGNVLNSASVSVELLNEYAKCQHFEKLFATGRLLKENKSDLSEYLYGDNKGRLIPLYILTLTERLKDIQESIADEVKNLSKHIRHIKDITAMQQSLGTVMVASEKIFVPEIIDTAFSMCGDIFKNNRIKIKKNYDEQFFLTTDKAKLLQILVNLLQNSRDALTMGGEGRSRLLSLSVKKSGDDNVDIIVQDNGIGISQEVLTRIFAFGYTTKKDGHGFGLHSSALAAKDLGGSLTAESDGINQGARFILNLPIKIASRRNANVPEQKLAYHCD
jgi:C4-dicarboxylate-specific signal transduction histidine kinase